MRKIKHCTLMGIYLDFNRSKHHIQFLASSGLLSTFTCMKILNRKEVMDIAMKMCVLFWQEVNRSYSVLQCNRGSRRRTSLFSFPALHKSMFGHSPLLLYPDEIKPSASVLANLKKWWSRTYYTKGENARRGSGRDLSEGAHTQELHPAPLKPRVTSHFLNLSVSYKMSPIF